VYAGLRPLLAGENEETSRLSREHIVTHSVPGLVVIAGGKWTTYRVMAKDAIDAAVSALDGRYPKSVTQDIALVGAEGYAAAWNQRGAIAARHGVHPVRIEHLLNRFGTLADEVLALIDERPALAAPVPGADDYLQAEIVYAATHEGALHLDDVLARRTRISIESWDRGEAAAEPVARLMGEVLGWTEEDIEREVAFYHARVQAERKSQEQADDRAADAVRLMAPDLLAGVQGDGSAPRAS
jgi:glycerol-3-phosphate dehydrogenase